MRCLRFACSILRVGIIIFTFAPMRSVVLCLFSSALLDIFYEYDFLFLFSLRIFLPLQFFQTYLMVVAIVTWTPASTLLGCKNSFSGSTHDIITFKLHSLDYSCLNTANRIEDVRIGSSVIAVDPFSSLESMLMLSPCSISIYVQDRVTLFLLA